MSVREASHLVPLRRLLWLMLCASFLLSTSAAATRPAALDTGYVAALAAADHFLQAWQAGDVESGIVLLTSQVKEKATTDAVDKFFSSARPSAYEIGRGKLLKHGRYEFPVVLVSNSKNRGRRRFSSIVIVDTGKNDWAVDKLP
jgi:hypothetical protein